MSVTYLDKLNTGQRQAVEHGISEMGAAPAPPLLIIAGAGTGKTNSLAHRVAHLIVNGADPRRILLMTFSRRAASEMIRRVERIARQVTGERAGILTDELAWAGTFHGIGARLLRSYANQIGLDPAFTIHDREDSADLMNLVRHELGFSKAENRFPMKGTCLAIYSRCINTELPIEDVLGASFPWCLSWSVELKELFASYVEAKQRQNVLDYDDLLLYWAQMMSVPALAEEIGVLFDHILVDEYQDTNRLQATILLGLKPSGRGLTVVGDDAQSIYSFRAATVRNILDFPGLFSPSATIVTLDQNYRSTQPLLAAANAVIALSSECFTKSLWTDRAGGELPRLVSVRDDRDQACYIVERVLENREAGARLAHQSVLFRASHHSGPLEVELTRRKIPYVKFGGLRFLEAAHVKDILAFLRFVENPRDRVSGFRVMLLIPGVGPISAQRALDCMTEAVNPIDALIGAPPPPRAGDDWYSFVGAVRAVHSGSPGWPGELERARLWYEPQLERIHEDFVARRADLLQLEQIASGYPSRERFLTELTLDPPQATSEQAGMPLLDEDYLILSTIHSAKGQEWKSVFVLNAVDGCIPSDLATGTLAEIEEERRLLYVAMTRAKNDLHLGFSRMAREPREIGTSMLRERASFPMTCYSCSRKRHGRWLPWKQGAFEPGRKECESICTPVFATGGGRAWPLIGKAVREMTVFVALLRAVNVGGTGKLPMADLKQMCERAGFKAVQTYIASGNVVLESGKSEAAVKAALEATLRSYAGKPVGVLVRTAGELAEMLAGDPFPKAPRNLTVVIFLDKPPPKDALKAVTGRNDEGVVLGTREIYVYYPVGIGKSKLRIRAAETGTARNMNTVARLVEMAKET